jgi:cathepsin L
MERFLSWASRNGKTYQPTEIQMRYSIFLSNEKYINDFNAQNESYTLAMNKFGDLTVDEFAKYYLGTPSVATEDFINAEPSPAVKLPTSFDWRTKGAVTPIKNQQQCGSCWAFSTTGSTEGCHFLTKNTLVSLSEQNLVDCSDAQGNQGCNGGLMTQAMDYIISNNGIDTESSYPYTAEDGNCVFNAQNVGATLKSYTNVQSGSETDLQAKVALGPTSVAIDASHSSFQFYSTGVYYERACSASQLDHGVLAIGWGTDSTKDFWLVKNSWGTDWGMNGFIEMSRNRNNNCGIATMATLPSC